MKYIPHFCSCYNSNFRCKIFQFQVLKQVSIKLRVSIVIWEPWSNVCARILSACEHLDEYDDVYQCLNPLKIYIEFRYWINVRWHKIDTILYMTFSCSFSWRHHAISIHHADCIYSAPGIILRGMCIIITTFDALRPEQNYRHFADDILKTFSWRKI